MIHQHSSTKEYITIEDKKADKKSEKPKSPEDVEEMINRGELTAVNVVSPPTLAGIQ